MDRTEHRFSPSGRLPGGDFRVRRQSCQQDGAEQQRERAAPPGHVCASAHGGVSGAQSLFAGADCPADCRVESVHVPPPFLAAVYAPRRFFMRAGGLPCGGFAPCIPGAEPGRHLQPQQKRYPAGGLPCLPPADHAFSLFSFPHPPDPLPLRGRGRLRFFHARGFAPCIPAPEPEAALAQLKNSVCLRGQCRQPRRGGTGGDGTIRRKRRRRLRWSSPPGQG